MSKRPLLSLGMPIFNGEDYVREALDSLLRQSLKDFELIISDNASTDRTLEICTTYAGRDERIRLIAQDTNLGAAANFNLVFREARGPFFKWAAHDDTLDPEALEACVAVLEDNPEVVLCHPRLVDVDADGVVLREFDRGNEDTAAPHGRFWRMILGDHNCAEIFGVIRSSALQETKLIRSYTDSDRTLLGELALLGRFEQASRVRFYRRIHPGKSDRVYPGFAERSEWFDPGNRGRVVMSGWRQQGNWLVAVLRSDLAIREKGRCLYFLAKLFKWRRKLYLRELGSALLHRPSGRSLSTPE